MKDYWPTIEPVAQRIFETLVPIAQEINGLPRAPELTSYYSKWHTNRPPGHRFQQREREGVRFGVIRVNADSKVGEEELHAVIAYRLGLARLYQHHPMFWRSYNNGPPVVMDFSSAFCNHTCISVMRQLAQDGNETAERVARRTERGITGWFANRTSKDAYKRMELLLKERTLAEISQNTYSF